jgi:NADP-dependent 3-hydroxy acid dehydrogenase YdfG
VEKAFDEILSLHGRLDAVVAAAGVNIAERSWSRLGVEGYREILQANLDGVFHCIRAALPALRRQSCGTVIAINSEAGRTATAKAGAAYVAAKFGLAGLIQSLNAEERAHGIRGVSIFPGDVSTPLLDRRPEPPSVEARARMVQPEDIAACVYLALTLPPRAIIEELVIRPAG